MGDKPAGKILGEGQSWNAQHDYVQTKSSMCNKQALLAAFAASGTTEVRTWVKDQAAKGVAVPSYPTFKNWVDAAKTGKPSGTTGTQASIAVGRSFEKEFEAQFEIDRKAAYLKFLEDKADALETDLSLVKAEIAKLLPTPTPSNATPTTQDTRYGAIGDAVLEAVTRPDAKPDTV